MINFDKTEFILGNIKYGDEGKAVVNVSNLSDNVVKLETSNSSCSCTTGSLKDTVLSPRGKTQFTIRLNTMKAGKGMNQVKSINLKYILNNQTFSQVFRLKVNVV